MTRSIFFYILLLNFVFLQTSCNSTSTEEREISIGFSQSVGNDLWRVSMNHAMEVEASLHPHVNLTIYNAHHQAKKQILDIEKFIDNKVDVIIISPFESDSIVPVIEKESALAGGHMRIHRAQLQRIVQGVNAGVK